MRSVLRHVRRVALSDDGLSDTQLLGAFLANREDSAFEAILRRHGPLVFGVCRRVLRDRHLAEDAFQATFLVLVRKAGAVRTQTSLGSWLYKVAYRTAMKALAMKLRRQSKESQVPMVAMADAVADAERRELLERFDAALNALPEKYRVPVVLCELEGKSRKQAAALLGVPEGTLSWRLAQARKLLAQRLAPYAGAFSAFALSDLASAGIPGALVVSTATAARRLAAGHTLAGAVSAEVLTLTEGVMRAMFLKKIKVLWLVAAVALTVAGVTFGAADSKKPAGKGFVEDEIEALRLEVEALRKNLQVVRKRVETLESEVKGLHAGAANLQPVPIQVWSSNGFLGMSGGINGFGGMQGGGLTGMPMGTFSGFGSVAPAPLAQPAAARPDPVSQIEGTLKILRERKGDKEAVENLEQALKNLKEWKNREKRDPNVPRKE